MSDKILRAANLAKLVPTNLEGIFGVEPPPQGFNPLTADRTTLLRYGYPPQPDAKKYPEAARLWQRVLSRPLQHIQPVLRQRPEIRRHAALNGQGDNASSNVWSGGVISSGGPFTLVSGAWTVPSVQPGAAGNGDWWSLAWVGIDGWNSSDVLQAGTGQHASRNNGVVSTEYFAWFEWFPNSWTEITNLPVNPGDAMTVSVQYFGVDSNGVGQGSASLVNLTTGQSATQRFSAPAGTTLQGNSVEWIMERPQFDGIPASLPEYGHISFSGCQACTGSAIVAGSTGQATNMTNTADNNLLSNAALGSDWDCSFVAAS